MSEHTSTAWVGLGRMGTAMASRLLEAGRPVSVWNRTRAKAEPLTDAGAVILDRLADAAQSDAIISMVSDDAALTALHGPDGLFAGEVRARVWIDCSTVSVAAARSAAEAARAAGVAYVSAPVSGNPGVVSAGNAVFAVSGDDDEAVEIAAGIVADMGRAVHRVGDGAAANVIKLCVNALLSVTMQSLAEVVVLADKLGVSRADLMEFINDSAIGSGFTRYKTENVVALDFAPTFPPEGQRKDVRLALAEGAKVELPMPVLSATEVEYSRLVASGLGEGKDYAALLLQVARDAGVELQPEVRDA